MHLDSLYPCNSFYLYFSSKLKITKNFCSRHCLAIIKRRFYLFGVQMIILAYPNWHPNWCQMFKIFLNLKNF